MQQRELARTKNFFVRYTPFSSNDLGEFCKRITDEYILYVILWDPNVPYEYGTSGNTSSRCKVLFE